MIAKLSGFVVAVALLVTCQSAHAQMMLVDQGSDSFQGIYGTSAAADAAANAWKAAAYTSWTTTYPTPPNYIMWSAGGNIIMPVYQQTLWPPFYQVIGYSVTTNYSIMVYR
jgi:hypothetical protein